MINAAGVLGLIANYISKGMKPEPLDKKVAWKAMQGFLTSVTYLRRHEL